MCGYFLLILFYASFCILPRVSIAQAWSEPQPVADDRGAMQQLSLCSGTDNRLHLVWGENADYNVGDDFVYYIEMLDDEWTIPIALAPGSGTVFDPHIVVDYDNIPHALWGENQEFPEQPFHSYSLLHLQLTENGGRIPDTLISTDSPNSYLGKYNIRVGRDNTLYVYWWLSPPGNTIWLKTWTDSAWTSATRPFPTWGSPGGAAFWPDLYIGPQDSLHMVFIGAKDQTGFDISILDQSLNYVWYSYKAKNDSLWPEPVNVYRNPHSFAHQPQIVVDGNNTRHIIWLEDPDMNLWPDDLYYSFSHTGKNWSDPIGLSSTGEVPLYPQIALDSNDTIHIIWTEIIPNKTESCSRQVTYRFGREASWSDPEVLFENASVIKTYPALTIDPHDQMHLVWIETAVDSVEHSREIKYSRKSAYPTRVDSDETWIHRTVDQPIAVTNYPNPFNDTTTFHITLGCKCLVWLRIYNVTGQLIKTLINGNLLAEKTCVRWDGSGQQGQLLPSGIYYYRVEAKTLPSEHLFVSSDTLILLK